MSNFTDDFFRFDIFSSNIDLNAKGKRNLVSKLGVILSSLVVITLSVFVIQYFVYSTNSTPISDESIEILKFSEYMGPEFTTYNVSLMTNNSDAEYFKDQKNKWFINNYDRMVIGILITNENGEVYSFSDPNIDWLTFESYLDNWDSKGTLIKSTRISTLMRKCSTLDFNVNMTLYPIIKAFDCIDFLKLKLELSEGKTSNVRFRLKLKCTSPNDINGWCAYNSNDDAQRLSKLENSELRMFYVKYYYDVDGWPAQTIPVIRSFRINRKFTQRYQLNIQNKINTKLSFHIMKVISRGTPYLQEFDHVSNK